MSHPFGSSPSVQKQSSTRILLPLAIVLALSYLFWNLNRPDRHDDSTSGPTKDLPPLNSS